MEEYDKNRTEYIKALEKAVLILQREVEHLRTPKPTNNSDSEKVEETKHIDTLTNEFSEASDYVQIHSLLIRNYGKDFNLVEANIFLLSNDSLTAIVDTENSSNYAASIQRLNEEGILDWVAEEKVPRAIPNLSDDNQKSTFLVCPLLVDENIIGYLIALSKSGIGFFDSRKQAKLVSLTSNIALAVDNIKSSDEIKNMNSQLMTLNNQMLHSTKMASIAEISKSLINELDSPIQVIKGNINFVELGLGDTGQRIKIIKEQLKHIETITLKIKNIGEEIESSSFVPLDFNSMIYEVLLFSDSQFLRDNIEIEKNFANDLPMINGNKAQLEQSILSILFFFRDTLPEGGKITISTALNKKKIISLIISCSSDEYEEDELNKILDSKSESIKGNNVLFALSLVKNAMKEHKSKIQVISIFGKGTSFKLHFPGLTD
jgi:K+-sensing histidine kinase KdpD